MKHWYYRPIVQTEHVAIERFVNAVTIEELILTEDEYDHVKNCSACYKNWIGVVKNLLLLMPSKK